MLSDTRISEFRSHFPILRDNIYLYSCSQGALSEEVESAARAFADSWRTSAAPWDEWVGVYEQVRAQFAGFIHADPSEIAIVTSASAGINPIASALDFGRRDKVVMSEYEFPTMGHIWLAQQSRGARVYFLNGVNNTVPAECYEQAIDERTAIVPVAQVSFINGFRPDLAAITRIAHERGALVFLDAFQDCGTRPIDVKGLGVDFLVSGTLKYLLGPPGLAFLYVRRDLAQSLTPTVTSWMGQRDVFAYDTMHLDLAPEARRFECGTPPIPNIYMAQAALELLEGFGMDDVAAQVERLAREFLAGARDLGIESKTPSSTVGPLVVLRAHDSAAVIRNLAARGIVASARRDGVRFSFHVYNTLDDVRDTLRALEENVELMVRP